MSRRCRLSPVDVLVLFVVRELLQNTVEHARATHMEFRVTRDEATLRIVAADDGDGFASGQPAEARQRGAHRAWRRRGERVRAVGGRLDARSAPGEGTRITITLRL